MSKLAESKIAELQETAEPIAVAKRAANLWLSRFREGKRPAFVIAGPNGTGKTHIAKALLWAEYFADASDNPLRPTGVFYTAEDLLKSIQDGEELPSLIHKDSKDGRFGAVSYGHPIVVIDDIGHQTDTQFVSSTRQERQVAEIYKRVFDYCFSPPINAVVITGSNDCSTLGKLALHLGKAGFSRLAEAAGCPDFFIEMKGVPDWRLRQSGMETWAKGFFPTTGR